MDGTTEFKLTFEPHTKYTHTDLGETFNGRCVSYDKRDQSCRILDQNPDTQDTTDKPLGTVRPIRWLKALTQKQVIPYKSCSIVRLVRSDIDTLTIKGEYDQKVLQRMMVFLLTQFENEIGPIEATLVMMPTPITARKPIMVFTKQDILLF